MIVLRIFLIACYGFDLKPAEWYIKFVFIPHMEKEKAYGKGDAVTRRPDQNELRNSPRFITLGLGTVHKLVERVGGFYGFLKKKIYSRKRCRDCGSYRSIGTKDAK